MTKVYSSKAGARALRTLAGVVFALALSSGWAASAQEPSRDIDSPTPIAGEVKGEGTDDKTEYFYGFTGGPGELTITFDVRANKGANMHGFDYELLDARSRRLAGGFIDPVRGESKRKVETVNLKGTLPQKLVLKLVVTEFVDTYRIRLGGAAVGGAAAAAPPATTTQAGAPLCLPKTGTLVIVTDSETMRIDLQQVKVSVEP